MEILTVRDFNCKAWSRYSKAVENWKPDSGGFPFIGLYLFMNGSEQMTKGYVATNNDNIHCYGATRAEAVAKFKE